LSIHPFRNKAPAHLNSSTAKERNTFSTMKYSVRSIVLLLSILPLVALAGSAKGSGKGVKSDLGSKAGKGGKGGTGSKGSEGKGGKGSKSGKGSKGSKLAKGSKDSKGKGGLKDGGSSKGKGGDGGYKSGGSAKAPKVGKGGAPTKAPNVNKGGASTKAPKVTTRPPSPPARVVGRGGGGYLCSFDIHANGAQGVPYVQTDTTADLHLDFVDDLSSVDFQLDVQNGQDITQAQLHCASAGSSGPTVSFLFGFNATGVEVDGTLSYGTLTNEDIVNDPSMDFSEFDTCGVPINNVASLYEAVLLRKIYLNVNSLTNPGGEVRGQILRGCGSL
jgi:hypothetical protein